MQSFNTYNKQKQKDSRQTKWDVKMLFRIFIKSQILGFGLYFVLKNAQTFNSIHSKEIVQVSSRKILYKMRTA